MTVRANRVIVEDTAIPLNPSDSGSSLVIRNKGNESVFLGESDVTTADGFELEAGEPMSLDSDETVYAVAVAGPVRVDVFRTGVN